MSEQPETLEAELSRLFGDSLMTCRADAKLLSACAEAITYYEAYNAKYASDEAAAAADDEGARELHAQERAAFDRVASIPATTAAGLREKAALAERWDGILERIPLLFSIAKDALAMAERESLGMLHG
jgi:hypothetical protein